MTKASTLTEIIQVLGKNPSFNQKNPVWYLFRNLGVSVAFYGKKISNSKLDNSLKLDIINWQKCEKKTFNSSVSC